ncbi:6639_t:CDS:1, partial [Paraglomus occultum]
MSIKLFCLEKGKTPAVQHAFPVNISREETVGDLKKVIKAEKQNDFARVDADKLKLWKVEIPVDRNELSQGQPLQDNDQLRATDYIDEHWTDRPLRKHVHIIVEVPT